MQPQEASAIAFRSHYKDARVRFDHVKGVDKWTPAVEFWLMASRLVAVERCGTQDVRGKFLSDCIEFRRPG